jgi:hypothetical protein
MAKNTIKNVTRELSLTNGPNRWVKKAIPDQKREMGGKCTHRGCGEKRLSYLRFEHIKQTPISRTGPRDRKEKLSDVRAHPDAYRLKCEKHALTDKATREHDARMRRLGHR